MATRQFAAGEFDEEEFVQLDKLLGSDWVDLDDAQFIERVEKVTKELQAMPNSSPGPSASTHGPLGDAAAVDAFFVKLLAMLNQAISVDAKDARDDAAVEAESTGLTKRVEDIAKRGKDIAWAGSTSPADPAIRNEMLRTLEEFDELDPKELAKAKALGPLYKPPSGRVRKSTSRPVRKSTATLDQAVTALTKALRHGGGGRITLE